MKINFVSLVLLLASGLPASAAIDLTPVPSERVLAGITFPRLNFREKDRVVTYEPPRHWTYSGGGAFLKLTPPNIAQAQAEIGQVPLAEPQSFDEQTVKALREKTLAAIPPDSQNPSVVADAVNSFQVNTHPTYEITVSYGAFGQEFMMAIIYVNLPDTQLRFRTIARKADFEKVHEAFRASIFSMQWRPGSHP